MATELIHSARASLRLEAAEAWLRRQSPDQPLLVLASSAFAATELIQRVARERGSVFGWHHNTLTRHAVELATPRLAELGLAPAGHLVVEALCAGTIHSLPGGLGRFETLADRPGLPRALARTLVELRAQGVSATTIAVSRPELARLLRALEDALDEARMADRSAVVRLAAQVAKKGAASEAPLLLLDLPLHDRCEAELVAALANRAGEVMATAISGDQQSVSRLEEALGTTATRCTGDTGSENAAAPATSLSRLQHHLFASPPPPAELGDDVEILSAPGESRECVEIARRILEKANEGVPFDRMAVLLRAPARYRAHIAEALRRASIPAYMAGGTVAPDPTGRALVALLACAMEGLSARRFAEYLSLGEMPRRSDGTPPPALPDADRWVVPDDELVMPHASDTAPELDAAPTERGSLVTPRRWERLLVDAAVIGGLDRWQRRLDGLAQGLRAELGALEDGDGPHADRILRQVQDISTLRKFALPLLEDLEALPGSATWGVWLDRLGALATRALKKPERVLAVLAELRPMADLGPVDLRQVHLVLERRLANLIVPPVARRPGRVLVAPCQTARGLSFDVVFIPGLAERLFPQKVIEDPVLRDHERSAASDWLETAHHRVEAERLMLRMAVGAANERVVLSYPRLDIDQARPRVPSFYGLEVLQAATGSLPGFSELAKVAEREGAARIGWPAPADAMQAIDAAEHDLALLDELLHKPEEETAGLAHYLLDANPHLGRALRFRARRWIRRWTAADGLVLPPDQDRSVLANDSLAARSYSCTALQHFARCPYKFYLYAIMRLSPREKAVAIEELNPLQRGSLVHDIQFEVLHALREDDALPITFENLDAARDTLETVLERVSQKYRDDLAPAIERVWLDSVATVRADLREWLRRLADEPVWVPWRFELAFGLTSRLGRDPASQKDAVPLDCGIQLRGAIDLVEKSVSGGVRATDHKTGKVRAEEGDVIGGGETLQPVLYALAIEKLLAEHEVLEGRLYYCTEVGRFEERVFPLDDDARAGAIAVAKTIGHALDNGFFPAAPKRDACRWCDYKTVCGPYEELRARKVKPKKGLARLEQLRKMR